MPTGELDLWDSRQCESPALLGIIQCVKAHEERYMLYVFLLNFRGFLARQDPYSLDLIVYSTLGQRVINGCHDDPMARHVGVRRTQELISRQHAWK